MSVPPYRSGTGRSGSHARTAATGSSSAHSNSSASSTTVDVDGAISPRAFRLLALAGVLVLLAATVLVLLRVTAVVGGTERLLTLVVLMVAGATLLERTISPRVATVAAVAAGGLGFAYYFSVTGDGIGIVFTATEKLVSDTIALATGLPVLRTAEAGIWTLGFAPGPIFLSWYLALRRRYVLSVVPGGLALLFLVLTGDAPVDVTLVGTVGAVAAIGFGELEVRRGTIAQADVLAVCFAAMIVLSMTITLVPGGTPGPTILVESDHDGTLEGSLTSAPEQTVIAGSVDLSPEVRFTVRSERESYWRTGVYDRFTGDSWIRTGQERPYEGRIPSPPGETDTVRQTVVLESESDVMPTAPQPVDVEGDVREITEVSNHGQFRPAERLIPGDTYNVESAVIDASPAELRAAGTDYPERIADSDYLQRPEDISSAFDERTREIVEDANAETPYDRAKAIEEHLSTSKNYSLSVDRPGGNVAEAFLLEMDEGYCVYFATTMVQMLRAEEIPARYVTGYTSGQQVDDNEWVVRGLNAHAWVEVYFPDHGWVAFEPTPGGERDAVHDERLEDAREAGAANVDTDRSEDVPVGDADAENESEPDLPELDDNESDFDIDDPPFDDPDSDSNSSENDNDTGSDPTNDTDGRANSSDPPPGEIPDPNRPGGPGDRDDDGSSNETSPDERNESVFDLVGGDSVPSPSREDAALGLAVLVGLVAGAHRTGATARVSREARMHWHGFRGTPDRDAARAYRRLEVLLERRYRPRRPSESTRQYLSAVAEDGAGADDLDLDPRARRVARIYERATYGDGVDRETADEAVDLVDRMARTELPLVGRFWR